MDLEIICQQVVNIARTVGAFIREERRKFEQSAVEMKGERDLVSYVDVTAEKMIVRELKALLPEAGFLTEEKTVDESGTALTWIIDPLDGTTNFIHGIPVFAVTLLYFKIAASPTLGCIKNFLSAANNSGKTFMPFSFMAS